MADMSPWGATAMAGNLGGQGASGAPSDSGGGGGLPRPGGTSVLPGSGLPTGGGGTSGGAGALPGAGSAGTPAPAPLPTGGGGGLTGGGGDMTAGGGMSGAPGMFHSQGWYANRPGLANPYTGQIGATSPGGGGLIPRPGGTMPPSGGVGAGGTTGGPGVGSMGQAMPGPGQTGVLGGGGMANNAGNSGIGPLLQLLMGGGGNGGQLGGLLQQLMGNPMYGQHSAGWLANRQDPNWLAQHPNAVGIGGTPMPRPGGTPPNQPMMVPNNSAAWNTWTPPNQPTMTPGFNVNTLSRPGGPGGVNQGAVGAPAGGMIPRPGGTQVQDNANYGQPTAGAGGAGIYMGSPIVNALSGGGGLTGYIGSNQPTPAPYNGPPPPNNSAAWSTWQPGGTGGPGPNGAIPRPGTTTASNNQMQQNDAQAQAQAAMQQAAQEQALQSNLSNYANMGGMQSQMANLLRQQMPWLMQ